MPEINLLKNLVSIQSLSGEEKQAVDFLVKESQDLDFDYVNRDEVGNFVARKGNGENIVLMVGHIDTVPGYVPVKIKDNILYGRGSVDAKGPLATFLWATHKMKRRDDLQVIVVGAVEEEGISKGARFIRDKYLPKYIINGEPSGISNITIGYKGAFRFDYIFGRTMSHGASADTDMGIMAFNFIAKLKEKLKDLSKDLKDSIFYQPHLEIRNINTKNDGLQEQISMKINVRIPPDFDVDSLKEFLEDYPIVIYENLAPFVSPKNNDLVRSFLKQIRNANKKPKFLKKTGTADFNTLAERFPEVPIVAYGPGDSSLDHTPNEHIDLNEYLEAIDILKNVLENL